MLDAPAAVAEQMAGVVEVEHEAPAGDRGEPRGCPYRRGGDRPAPAQEGERDQDGPDEDGGQLHPQPQGRREAGERSLGPAPVEEEARGGAGERPGDEVVLRGRRLVGEEAEGGEEAGGAHRGADAEAEAPGGCVDGEEDRELREVLRHCVEAARAGCCEQEVDLLLGERLELVDPVGGSVGDPVDPAVVVPGCDSREVVGERVPVVRRDGERKHELVTEQQPDRREVEERPAVRRDLAERGAGGRERRERPSEPPPGRARRSENDELRNGEPAARHIARRRENKRDESQVRDEGDVRREQRRAEALEPQARPREQRCENRPEDQREPNHRSHPPTHPRPRLWCRGASAPGQELERPNVSRADNAEVAVVERGDLRLP